jgi:isopenicillin N synthase-like dioxygenase
MINSSIIKFLLVIVLIRLELLLSIDINDILKSNSTKSSDSCNVNIPIIDISSLKMATMYRDKNNEVVKQIRTACTETGFFYVSNHGVPANLIKYLEKLSRDFFGLSKDIKRNISMDKGGHAWRGYFSVGEEVTSGIPDQKEGIYFGTQGDPQDDRPLHGVNLYPNDSMKDAVEAYMEHMKQLGELIMKAIVLSLGLDYTFVDINFQDPTELFRIFSYPPHDPIYGDDSFAVGTHSDYGFITILWQDGSGGLQVKPKGCSFRKDFWIDAQPVENTFVINLGDALEHLTGGYLTSTPHRVIQRQGADNLRISMP